MKPGNLRETPEGVGSNPAAEIGYRLSDNASASLRASMPFELPHLDLGLPSVEIPTGVYVALGMVGVAIVGAPFLGLYLLGRGARAAGQAAVAVAPTVATVGPALLPLMPEAAPVVAAAAALANVQKGSSNAGQPVPAPSVGSVTSDAVTLLRTLGVVPPTLASPPRR